MICDDGTIGIRITSEDFSRDLCMRFRKPIVSTSANFSGMKSPQNFNQIDSEIIDLVDYVVEYRQSEMMKQVPSSIIKLETNGNIEIIRK